jgi:hypothetical protein
MHLDVDSQTSIERSGRDIRRENTRDGKRNRAVSRLASRSRSLDAGLAFDVEMPTAAVFSPQVPRSLSLASG